jgi:uncharacterized protein (DUF983 family)
LGRGFGYGSCGGAGDGLVYGVSQVLSAALTAASAAVGTAARVTGFSLQRLPLPSPFNTMQVTRAQIVARGMTLCCPNCGARSLFRDDQFFVLNRECPECGLRLERDEGGFLGAMSLNYGVTVVGFLVPVLVLYLTGVLSGRTASMVAGVGAVAVPLVLYRFSRSWWLMNYYLVLPHHLPANQEPRRSARDDENT